MKTKDTTVQCPHCGHSMHILLDYSNGDQDFIEDCANCCNPVHFSMHIDEVSKKLDVRVSADDEQYY